MAEGERTDRGTVMALAAMSLAVLVLANDFSAINVAIPQIEKDFDTDVTTAQWVVNAYALTFGVLIVTGGRLADLFGRRRAFFAGSAIFATMSLSGGVAQTEAWLIGSRVLMGVGGALMWPAILGMTYAALPPSKAGLAGGLILGAAGFGNAVGPLLGGAFTDFLSWRWIFYFNLPITAFAVLVTYLKVHQPREQVEDTRIDYAGVATVSIGLVSLLLAFDQALDWGWGDPRIIGMMLLCAGLLIAFGFIERGAGAHALVPKDVMRNREFTLPCVAILFMSAVFFAVMLYVPQYLLKVQGFNPVEAGAGMLPMMGVFAATSFVAGPLYNRVGGKVLVTIGAGAIAVGPFLMSLVNSDSSYLALVPGLVIAGLGIGLFYPTATTVGVTSVDPSRSSLAGGIIYMFQIAGGAIGLGLTTTIFTEAGKGASDATAGFMDGFETAFRVDAGIAVLGFLIALLFIGGRPHVPGMHHRPAGHSPRGHGP
jgi:EmrB/QacA subfamily drug resistance transporter